MEIIKGGINMATNRNPYSDIDLSIYENGYQMSQEVIDALNKKQEAENAVANYGDFAYKNQSAYDKALDAITNRKKFSYDLNADALYQQYKDNYVTQGKQASMDVMGQAAAMTGGYGNSYAATVGNQTYQGYLTQLNNIAPELYKLALDKYNAEGSDLMNQFGVLQSDRQTAYGEWGDKYNRLVGERDYHSNEYNNAYGRDYTAWNDNRSYDTSQYWNEYNAGYQAERDAIADAQWQKEFELAQRQASRSSGGSGGSSGSGKTPTARMYEEALALYQSGGEGALDSYFEKYPDYNIQLLIDYCISYGGGSESDALQNRRWTVTNEGGVNWFRGVNNNAELTDQFGNTYTAKELKKELLSQGMSEADANEFLRKYGVYE